MMPPPDALPLHLMLMLMQSGISPAAFQPWNVNSWNFDNPWAPRLKSPLEQASDQWQNASRQLSDLWLSAWPNPKQNAPASKASSRRMTGSIFTGFQDRPRHEGGVTGASVTDTLPHFLQPEFLQALGEQSFSHSAGFMQGLQAYMTSDYERPPTDDAILWQSGSAKLLDLAPDMRDGLAVLCVPSLINRSYILDLYPDASLLRYLKAQGFRPLLLDWGTPGPEEMEFGTADYMTGYALHALQTLRESHDGPIALLGYCMGGIFAVAMAQLAQLYVDALVLLATPWDFSAPDTPVVLLNPATQTMLSQWIGTTNPVPPLVTQTIFHLIDPWRIQEKYSRYPSLTPQERIHFLAVEQWVNDGVPLTQRVAQECFVDWPQKNILATHQWKVGRRWIEPESITCPTLAVLPTKDAIVPLGTAEPLANMIPRCDVLKPESGHISMVVGKQAKQQLWKPLAGWLKERF